MERVKVMRNGNRAEENNSLSVSTELQDDLIVRDIISRLPLKFVVQCKVVSKNFNSCISDPKFSQTLLQREMDCSTQLIYTLNGLRKFHKISLNPIPTTCKMTLPDDVELLASCKGLILFDFDEIKVYSVFNPITGAHQLIPYLPTTFMMIGYPGLAVDYSSSDQYKLVTISKLAKNPNPFYKFHVISSKRSGLWREIQLRSNTFSDLAVGSPPVYWRDSLYWLRSDVSVIAFDTKREEAIILDRPEFIDDCNIIYGKILTGRDIWLGVAQGLLTLVCIFEKSIVIADYARSNWSVSHTLDNFISGTDGIINGFPVLIDSKQVFFMVEHPLAMYHVYEYDTENSEYRKAAVSSIVSYPLHSFQPTLASVHATPLEIVNTRHLSYISAKLDVFRRFITEGVSDQEEESSSESSSSSAEEVV
ncbi:hypothetical protein K7X08_024770 [Anisodus acutangulus]|uniref:F-box protein n=1 Tax=Anisodus acutangulus TaxID=402998 RepID=A0A9Q1RFK8_9SOLA|nr:hypothetical protein K7X08_024770 [Anisodus acutangulus]